MAASRTFDVPGRRCITEIANIVRNSEWSESQIVSIYGAIAITIHQNLKSPKCRCFYFLVKFYTNHIIFHILIIICEF